MHTHARANPVNKPRKQTATNIGLHQWYRPTA